MRILAIDTALEACAAAVLDTAQGIVLARESVAMTRGHAEALMPLIARVMEASGGGFDALDRIAVTVGPGSFTGLRVGIAAARGFALATNKPAIGLTTLGHSWLLGGYEYAGTINQIFNGWIGDVRIVNRALRPSQFMIA